MFEITKRLKDASIAHRLLNYNGPCENLHGHTYHFEVSVESKKLDELGLVVDFGELKKMFDNWIQANWDHSTLIFDKDKELLEAMKKLKKGNRHYILPTNTTAENMSKFLFEKFSEILQSHRKKDCIKLKNVKVWETDTSLANYKGK